MPDFPLGKRLSNSLVGGWLPWTFAHWASTYIVSFKSYLPIKKIYLSWTAGWDFSRALSHGSERLRTKLRENHTLSCSTFLYMYGLDKGVYPPSPSHRISDFVFNCHLFFLVVSLDTPVLPTKQWEEHLKLRTLVEKIREKQTGMISVDVLQFCCTILYSCLVKLIY